MSAQPSIRVEQWQMPPGAANVTAPVRSRSFDVVDSSSKFSCTTSPCQGGTKVMESMGGGVRHRAEVTADPDQRIFASKSKPPLGPPMTPGTLVVLHTKAHCCMRQFGDDARRRAPSQSSAGFPRPGNSKRSATEAGPRAVVSIQWGWASLATEHHPLKPAPPMTLHDAIIHRGMAWLGSRHGHPAG